MIKKLFHLLFRINGWKMKHDVPPEVFGKCVMTAAPHTSLWDAVYALAAFNEMKIPVRFAIKKEFNYFPVGWFLRSAGALWIDRSATAEERGKKSYVDAMAEVFGKEEHICMLIAPEGTRKRTTKWKTGFYHVAKKAGVPIALGYLDYAKKEAGVGALVVPSDDMQADMRKIMDFYRNIQGKHPERFALDARYDQPAPPQPQAVEGHEAES
ncbi:MAG: acyltransferase [Bacteroidetes bacterium]|nr:MAG: acyltransferase [Bacteroidota bacterium]